MWDLLADALSFVLGLFGFGKPDPVAQGEKLGKAEHGQADAQGELSDISKANAARNSVDDSAAAILRDSANSGPAKPD